MAVDEPMADVTESDPLDRLGFLLARNGAIANSRVHHAFESCGLAARQGTTLMLLGKSGFMSQQALAAALSVDPSVMVAILNDLESAGLVERRRDPSDRRRHIVAITEAGRRQLVRAQEAVAEVEQGLFADLTPEEVASLRDLLARVRTTRSDEVCTEQ
ncbi:MarR family winged helix-turn-helix transcriptional regulator [Streptomyces sp. WMMC940]|uniref:MarR family winged helix-turn-helix transcriptional regulator n=1 Tax=Streptomyces sp. WMMC940 TaxID=3015153 RepID=UPI0022B5E6DE|nr:MarR family winged helix-turn-helix transcriptional regulator [Streptomyces sp. WMMC940]MCZ7456599.1 MarR family winged helix-turn-helix transcriptional regulator [Streptomyces sp. WMMC940]